MKNSIAFLGAASLAIALPAAPAHAGGDITNFTVRNCTSERIFVCSFDKTDGSLKIPYKARGVQPGDKKEFGCASLNKCKVIVGVSKRKSKKTLSSGMEAALSAGSVAAAGVTGASAATAGAVVAGTTVSTYTLSSAGMATVTTVGGATTAAVLTGVGIAAAVLAVGAAGSVAGIEIADGWSDGEVCNQVRRAAQKAGMKPKSFMKADKVYRVVERYGTNETGKHLINPDGTAVMAYVTEQSKDSCQSLLAKQLIKD